MSAPPSDLRAKILAAARNAPSPTRAQSQLRSVITIAIGYAAALVVFFALGGGRVAARPVALVATTAIGWSAVALASVWWAVARGKSMLGRSREALLAITIAVAPLLLAWGIVSTQMFDVVSPERPMRFHVFCFAATLALALGPFIALLVVRRASDPVHPRITAAAIGAAAGAWGSVLIDLHCPTSAASHIAFGHVLPTVVLALLGLAAGDRVLGVRASSPR